jgi:hypothetical protein
MRLSRLALPLALASLTAAPAAAELRDVAAQLRGSDGQVWLVFDEQPRAVTATSTGSGLELTVEGVTARTRQIQPHNTRLVRAVTIADSGPDTVRITLSAQHAWAGATAQVFQNGVYVSLSVPAAGSAPGTVAEAPAGQTTVAQSGPQTTDDSVRRTEPGGDFAPRTRRAEPDAGHSEAPASQPAAPASTTPAPQPQSPAAPAPASNRPTGACAAQAAAVEESPWDDERLFAHAACLSENDALPRAAAIYEQMLAFDPENFRALLALAELRAEQGQRGTARELYSRAASHAISDAEAARARARLRELRDQ